MARENKNQYPILGFLSGRNMSGYDLQQLSKKISRYYWSDCNAQVYNTLKNLELKKLVSSNIDETSGARNRRVYSITPKGLEFYKNWLETPIKCQVYRDELLLKLANAQHLPKEILQQHLKNEHLQIEIQLNELKDVQEHIATDHKNQGDQVYLLAVYDYVKSNLETKLVWIKKSLEKFK